MKLTNSQKKTILAIMATATTGERRIFGVLLTSVLTPWVHDPRGHVLKRPELVKTMTKQMTFTDHEQLLEFAARQGVEYISLVKLQEREVVPVARGKGYTVAIQVNRRRKVDGVWLDMLEEDRRSVQVGPPKGFDQLPVAHKEAWAQTLAAARLWTCPVWRVKITWTDPDDQHVSSEVLKHRDLATLKKMVRGFTNKLRKAGERVNRLPKDAYVQG